MSLPTIANSSFGPFGLTATAVDGTSVTISADRILAYQGSLKAPGGGNSPQLVNAVRAWLAQQISAALGWANADPSQIGVTYNTTSGAVTALAFG